MPSSTGDYFSQRKSFRKTNFMCQVHTVHLLLSMHYIQIHCSKQLLLGHFILALSVISPAPSGSFIAGCCLVVFPTTEWPSMGCLCVCFQLLSESQINMVKVVNSVSDTLNSMQKETGNLKSKFKADLQRAPVRSARPKGCSNGRLWMDTSGG